MDDFSKLEKKWQKKWADSEIFKVKEDSKKKKFYNLEMFPYPSGSGLHMGHVRNYAIGDVIARFKRMNGFNVLYPMGYDAFGLPAENAAIKDKTHPKVYTNKAIKNIKEQQTALGLSYDWGRLVVTCKPEYYKWNQYFFLKFMEKGLAYRKEALVNWCPGCETVLANEQVEDGKCWRCSSEVEEKPLEQWFLKITDYADELLNDIDKLGGWPEKIRIMQQNWIGRSEGTIIEFGIKDTGEKIPIFTTRCDTIYGVTFMVFAPEHPLVKKWVKGTKYEKNFEKFLNRVKKEGKFERTSEESEKEGMFIGKHAVNPLTKEDVPVYVGNFVIYDYGAGAVMAVPAHDQRDFDFAKKYDIPIKLVIQSDEYEIDEKNMGRAFLENGHLINSSEFDGMNNRDAIGDIGKKLKKIEKGGPTINYKLRDWLISRQRYWGTPIPIVYCEKCGAVPVPEKDLPVILPEGIKFTGHGNPLASSKKFLEAKCPKCGGKARRETDTMDTFFDSSWYFLRYCSNMEKKNPFDKKAVNYWMPVDQYIGGAEHAVMHLLYARFFCKVLRDLGLVKFDEPFTNLFNQGILFKDGHKMSKSFGNVVGQEEISKQYGIDTARLFLLSVAAADKQMEWSDKGVQGSFRLINRIFSLTEKIGEKLDSKTEHKMNKAIKEVTEAINSFELNKAVVSLISYVDYLTGLEKAPKEAVEALALIISPYTPHIAEEMWEKLGKKGFVSVEKWPSFDEKKIDARVDAVEDAFDKTRKDIMDVLQLIKVDNPKRISLFISSKWKFDVFSKIKKALEKTRDPGEIIKSAMDKEHGSEIPRIVQMVLKDSSKIPAVITSQKAEYDGMIAEQKKFEEEFKCNIEILKAEDSKDEKAQKAMPGKIAILIN